MPTKQNPIGYLCLVLHAHLPFVRHPEFEDPLEEDWLHEAITETYLPLLSYMEDFLRDGIDFRLTMSITPPLAAMLGDKLLQDRYIRHLEKLIELAEKETIRTRFQPEFNALAHMYLRKFRHCYSMFAEKYRGNILEGFRQVQETGKLEIITCGATHGFLPLLNVNDAAVRAQVTVGRQAYEHTFGRSPRGIWNGECGYYPGLDEHLAANGIRFFFVDAHGILHASKRPRYGVYAPLYCPSGVAAFGRDPESSKSVWSAEEGYPGDYNYREFYRDIGFDLDYEYIRPYIHESGLRINTGIKYYRITGKTAHKEPYNYERALEVAATHAGNFMFNRQKQAEYLRSLMDRPAIIVSPYDAELFGHWWYEGPDFLNFLTRKMHFDQDMLAMITPSEYLELYPKNQVAVPSLSSWGHKGYCEVWLEGSNDWIYRHLHKAADRMVELANQYRHTSDRLIERTLNQAARELLLAQSSDWAFIMKTRTMVEYAVRRTKQHILAFTDLYEMVKRGQIDEGYLSDLEYRNNIFPFLDFRVYATEK
ncbi:MAG: glycoside hydrolase family 57 protein [Candidatus Sumerlaeaceae bacterium]